MTYKGRSTAQLLAHKLEQQARQARYQAKWRGRVSKLDIAGDEIIHHRTGNKLAKLYFDIVGRVDKDNSRPSVKTIAQYINMTPWTLKRELIMRAELLFCTTMKRGAHAKFHITRRLKGLE